MICPLNFRPFLKIGRYHVAQYDDRWLKDALLSAGSAANCEVAPYADDLIAGVSHYLEHRCQLNILEVEALIKRITLMLDQVGLSSVADELHAAAPPVTIALDEMAEENPYELGFFSVLREDIEDLSSRGVHELRFSGLRPAVQKLSGSKKWSLRCQTLQAELEAFLVAIPKRLAHA